MGQQDLATYAATVKDPVTAFLRLRVSTGNIKIVKTSEDGRVDGITFRIKGNGVDKTAGRIYRNGRNAGGICGARGAAYYRYKRTDGNRQF